MEPFSVVNSKTVPLPAQATDRSELVRMMRTIATKYGPLLKDKAMVHKHIKRIAYAATTGTGGNQHSTRGLQVTDESVQQAKWAMEGCVIYTIDKDLGEMAAECPCLYDADYDGMFAFGEGTKLELMKV